MPNYVNQFINPANTGQQAMNNLFAVKSLKQADTRNALADRKLSMEEEAFALQKLQVPYKFMQLKSAHIAGMAKNISGLPREQRSGKYASLYEKVIPAPIAKHPEMGPLGVAKNDEYLSI